VSARRIAQEVEPVVQLDLPVRSAHRRAELWEMLGHTESVFDSPWPAFDPELRVSDTIELAVQVNGKLRGTLVVARPSRKTRRSRRRWPIRRSGSSSRASQEGHLRAGRLLNLVV
jgi:leucyl-tRNA synthetase